MSTRCQIGFYDNPEEETPVNDVFIYRHSDGYPEGVITEIKPFLEFFKKKRGWHPAYCSARLLQYLCNGYDKELKDNPNDFTGVIGYGIDNVIHGDIEYLYKITPDSIIIEEVRYDYTLDEHNMEIIKTIDY